VLADERTLMTCTHSGGEEEVCVSPARVHLVVCVADDVVVVAVVAVAVVVVVVVVAGMVVIVVVADEKMTYHT
jgi:hypothetical protein